eukprot:1114167-Pyramimonas_sp.AAC.1
MPCAEWYTSVDSQRLSTAELKSKAFWAVDSGACVGLCGRKGSPSTGLNHLNNEQQPLPQNASRKAHAYRQV